MSRQTNRKKIPLHKSPQHLGHRGKLVLKRNLGALSVGGDNNLSDAWRVQGYRLIFHIEGTLFI